MLGTAEIVICPVAVVLSVLLLVVGVVVSGPVGGICRRARPAAGLAASPDMARCVWQQRQVACLLDGDLQAPLLLGGHTGLAPGQNAPLAIQEL